MKFNAIIPVKARYPEIGVCGPSCRLCPGFHRATESRCSGCKTRSRITLGCSFTTCALQQKGVEFCWECKENGSCERWEKHRETGKKFDSFKCYQTLENDIAFIQKNGVAEFEKIRKVRVQFLEKMLQEFDEGRSKSYDCIVAPCWTSTN